MATNTHTACESLKEVIGELLINIPNGDGLSDKLRDILKATIGGDEASDNRFLPEVGAMLWEVKNLTKFVRTLGNHLPAEAKDEKVLAITELYNEIDYERFDELIYDGLSLWIYNEDPGSLSCLSYAAEAANTFQRVAELVDLCEEYCK